MAGRYVTTPERRIASIFLGAALGVVLMFAGFLFLPGAPQYILKNGIILTCVLCSGFFGVLSLTGVGLVAAPLWRLMERKRFLGWRAAMVCGASLGVVLALVFVALLLLIMRVVGAPSERVLFGPVAIVSSSLGAIGCVVAAAMWRYAYRRELVTDLAETFN